MKKLFILFLVGICSSSVFAQRQDVRRGGGPAEVLISSGGGAITNVSWENDTFYTLNKGTNTLITFIDTAVIRAPITFEAKTNITLRGMGMHLSSIWAGQTGNLMIVTHCANLTFEDFTLEGTRTTANLTNIHGPNVIFGGMHFIGTNSHITFRRVRFKNLQNHGIFQLSQTFPRNSAYVTVEDCIFDSVGSTNAIGYSGVGDGVAVNIIGPNQTIRNNLFTNCALNIEFEGAVASSVVNTLIEGNRFLGTHKQSIVDLGMAGENDYTDIIIRGNIFDYNTATAWSLWADGIWLKGGKRVLIEGNIFRNTQLAIQIQPAWNSERWIVRGNIIENATSQGISVWQQSASTHSIIIENNQIDGAVMGIRVVDGQYIDIRNNQLNKLGNGANAIELVHVNGCRSNSITGNRIYKTAATAHALGINIASGVSDTLVEGNIFSGHSSSAWSDSGTSTKFLNNWIGTNLIAYVIKTNSYSGTNVVINPVVNKVQALIATNNMLIIWTNNGSVNAESQVSIYNNTATNISIWHSAGVRFMGGASNTVNAGKELAVAVKTVGTNISLSFAPQVN